MLAGVAYLGGATIAEQASLLSKTIKSQITNVKSFLDSHGVDTSFFDLGSAAPRLGRDTDGPSPSPGAPPKNGIVRRRPLASSGGAIVSQNFKLLLGTISAVGNIFIVLFLGLGLRRTAQHLSRRAAVSCARKTSHPRRPDHRPHPARRWSAG